MVPAGLLNVIGSLVLLGVVLLPLHSHAAESVIAVGLLKNMAVLEIDGKQRTLKAGKTSPEGVTLVSSTTKQAVIEIDGKRQTLTLSRRVGGVKYQEPGKQEVRVASGVGGHYFTPGRINNKPVNFLVDTGATSVVLNSLMAESLRINYKAGRPIQVNTANGVTTGFLVMLNNVSVGTVKVNNVEAVINQGAFPTEILLGNSFLSRVEMNIERGVLVLQSKI
ncbi:MAG: TIGR02281 family clan AA aspartic protease [Agarilytica sp.]